MLLQQLLILWIDLQSNIGPSTRLSNMHLQDDQGTYNWQVLCTAPVTSNAHLANMLSSLCHIGSYHMQTR